ncbi:MAG: response regulator [Anaerolineae bacterium]|nr:response regulator [Anaerolineae bacterium]
MNVDTDTARWLLAHLNDNPALSSTELLPGLPGLREAQPLSRADALRAIVLDCIEFLRPPRGGTIRSPEARSYAVLWLRYVEGMTVEEVGEEINLSERQVHRELRAAEAKFADVLSTHLATIAQTSNAAGPGSRETQEISVAVRPAQFGLARAIQATIGTIEPLAKSLGRTVSLDVDLTDDHLFADEGVLRQLLIQSLSLVLQSSAEGCVRIVVSGASERMAEVKIGPVPLAGIVSPQAVEGLRKLATALNLELSIREDRTSLGIALKVPLHQPKTVMVVEDSTVAVELYRRYLEPGGFWRVVGVSEPRLAYDMARNLQPSVIVLDLLMPGTDGWTILNVLRAREDTADIPVIVCSVFEDPLLAEALGAKAHLRKPVSQVQLLSAVNRWAR